MDTLTDAQLSSYAQAAFQLGLKHGQDGTKRFGSFALAGTLLPGPDDRRALHRTAFHKVYGAGYTLAAQRRKVTKP